MGNEFKTIGDYQLEAHKTCKVGCFCEGYLAPEIISEAGEVAGFLKREIRDGYTREGDSELTQRGRTAYLKEPGDVCWGLAELGALRKSNPFLNVEVMYDIYVSGKGTEMFWFLKLNSLVAEIAADPTVSSEVHFKKAGACVTLLAGLVGSSLQEVLQMNITKLTDRAERNVISGKGDNR